MAAADRIRPAERPHRGAAGGPLCSELHVGARRGAQSEDTDHPRAMERLVSSLSVRLISVVLVILAALVPPLYLGVSAIVREGYAERFVNSLRAYSRLVADELEAIDGPDFDRRAVAVLDSAVLSGQVVFAEVRDGTNILRSTIALPVYAPPRDDFHFGDQHDKMYFITHTVNRSDHSVSVRLGFDEVPTLERTAVAQ